MHSDKCSYTGESKVALGAFVEVGKVMNHIELWDAEFAWYSECYLLDLSQWLRP